MAQQPILVLDGLDGLRLLAAYQVLSMPSRAMGVTHKTAREAIRKLAPSLGRMPKGKPQGSTLAEYVSWHMGQPVTER